MENGRKECEKYSFSKPLRLVISLVIILCVFLCSKCFADVGSFESYDSGGSSSGFGSSSHEWASDSSSSSFFDKSGDGYSSSPLTLGDIYVIVKFFGPGGIAFLIIVFIYKAAQKFKNDGSSNISDSGNVVYTSQMNQKKTEDDVEKEVKAVDELFNKDEFLAWTRNLFIKLQEAWSARDWSTIRVFETNELFEQHQKQLQDYINRKQINKLERICVLSAKLMDFKQTGDKDIISVELKSRMVDYIIDENTVAVVKGDKTTDRYSTYRLDFIRKTGVKTKPGTEKVNTTNCPNCGAPTQIASSGKCEYCGSVITTSSHDWALANLQKLY